MGQQLALNSRGSIDPRWLTHNASVLYGLELATIEIFNSVNDSDTYNAETNSWDTTRNYLYTGKARIQTINSVTETNDTYDPTFIKTVRVQISYNRNQLEGSDGQIPDIRPNDKMLVTASPYNTSLEKFSYIVFDVLNSSNAWERTLLCRIDTELDPTNTSGV